MQSSFQQEHLWDPSFLPIYFHETGSALISLRPLPLCKFGHGVQWLLDRGQTSSTHIHICKHTEHDPVPLIS